MKVSHLGVVTLHTSLQPTWDKKLKALLHFLFLNITHLANSISTEVVTHRSHWVPILGLRLRANKKISIS